MAENPVSDQSSEKDAPAEHKWTLFDEVDTKHTYSALLQQVVDHVTKKDLHSICTDTYEILPLCKELEQLKEGKTKQLLEAVDHLRYFLDLEGERPKKIPSIRLKPTIHHVNLQECIVNKQYSVRMELHNKSPLKAS